MHNEHEPTPDVPPDTSKRSDLERLTVRSPEDLIVLVAYMMGFHPSDSLVVLGLRDSGNVLVLRVELPEGDEVIETDDGGTPRRFTDLIGDQVAHVLQTNKMPAAMLVGYGSGERVTPVIEPVRYALERHRVRVLELLRVHEGRWWSYLCQDPGCCPPEGTAYDATTSVTAAQATLAGRVIRKDRDQIASTVAAVGGQAREAMKAATERAEQRALDQLSACATASDQDEAVAEIIGDGKAFIEQLAQRAGTGQAQLNDDEVAWLGVLLTSLRLRDEAWIRIDVNRLREHVAFWMDVVRRVDERYVTVPATLMAYAAYAAGDGVLANIALDRALDVDEHYSLAHLLREVMNAGIAPEAARLSMTPDELTDLYKEGERTRTLPSGRRQLFNVLRGQLPGSGS
jgi:hypothetical protein